jgi:hypothetical protein
LIAGSIDYHFAGLGVLIVIPQIIIGYRLNKAKNHSRVEAYDDRLTHERMTRATDELIQLYGGERSDLED